MLDTDHELRPPRRSHPDRLPTRHQCLDKRPYRDGLAALLPEDDDHVLAAGVENQRAALLTRSADGGDERGWRVARYGPEAGLPAARLRLAGHDPLSAVGEVIPARRRS